MAEEKWTKEEQAAIDRMRKAREGHDAAEAKRVTSELPKLDDDAGVVATVGGKKPGT